MEQQSRLKQRLVGAIVLVALGVIFIPMLLDGEREEEFIVNGSSIPAKPAEIENIRQIEFSTDNSGEASEQHRTAENDLRIPVDEHSAPLSPREKKSAPTNKEKSSKARLAKESPAQIEQPPASTVAKNKAVSAAPVTHAWAVQVGSFKQKSNALKLRNKLRKQKYKAFIEGLQSDMQLVYRVRLGPYVSRASAEQVRDRLKARQNMKGLVVRHP